MSRETIFSPCRKYRYTLWRQWDAVDLSCGDCDPCCGGRPDQCAVSRSNHKRYAQFIGLNPSTADETQDDPTIRRCIGFAKSWGYGALCMTNLFAWRDTDPKAMKRIVEPVGADNDRWLVDIAKGASVVIAAWGKDGNHLYRNVKVKQLLRPVCMLMCLRTISNGQPEHPLYLPKTLTPKPYEL